MINAYTYIYILYIHVFWLAYGIICYLNTWVHQLLSPEAQITTLEIRQNNAMTLPRGQAWRSFLRSCKTWTVADIFILSACLTCWSIGILAYWQLSRSEPVQLVASLVQAVPCGENLYDTSTRSVLTVAAWKRGADADWPGASGPWLRTAESTKGRGVSHRWG